MPIRTARYMLNKPNCAATYATKMTTSSTGAMNFTMTVNIFSCLERTEDFTSS